MKTTPESIEEFYTHRFDEVHRLESAFGGLERLRTQEILNRFVPRGARVADVGGGTGPYSFYLSARVCEVHLVDIAQRHLDQARERQESEGLPDLASYQQADARELPFSDESMDIVLLFGPLYHLVDRDERKCALREALRVLRTGGTLLAVTICRYAGLVYGITEDLFYQDDFLALARREIATGVRSDTPEWMETFDEAYFHRPDEAKEEIASAGFLVSHNLGVIGNVWQSPGFEDDWKDPAKRTRILEVSRLLENEPILGPRTLTVGRKK